MDWPPAPPVRYPARYGHFQGENRDYLKCAERFAEWSIKNFRLSQTSFEKLEYGLLKKFHLDAVKDLNEVLETCRHNNTLIDFRIIRLAAQANLIATGLLSFATDFPVSEIHQHPSACCSRTPVTDLPPELIKPNSDRPQQHPDWESASITLPEFQRLYSYLEPEVIERLFSLHQQHLGRRSSGCIKVVGTKHISPHLPPEIVQRVLNFVGAVELAPDRRGSSSTPTTLLNSALVNRAWSVFARKALLKRVKLAAAHTSYNFTLSRTLWARLGARGSREANTYIQELDLKNISPVWDGVLRTIFLFPNLRRLTLGGLPGIDGLQHLFTQTLPSLQKLSIRGNFVEPVWRWNYESSFETSENRDSAGRFFSRLRAIEFGGCRMNLNDLERHEFVEAGHQKLETAKFPEDTPDPVAAAFIARCSGALVALDTSTARLSQTTLETIATKCTGLKALAVGPTKYVDINGLEYLIKTRGPDLICICLGTEPNTLPRTIMQSLGQARSLKALRLSAHGEEFEQGILELIPTVGANLKHLDLAGSMFETISTLALIDRVADHCPNLEWFGIPCTSQQQQEIQPHPQQSTTDNEGGSGSVLAPDDTYGKLLRKCPKLQSLVVLGNLDLSRFTDPGLKGRLERMNTDCMDSRPISHYFDHSFYSR
ncbi:hypothetical protein HK102_004609 [Quaeritorhiza haematococci]|nr:hypothetical protein HK102_004609 [Quaeritorhiza haematococci]